jgi:hypothetical protein
VYPQVSIVVAAVLALLLSVAGHAATHAVTMAHEGGHALVGVLMGGKLQNVTFSPQQRGATRVSVPGWLGDILTDLAGYLGPSMFGLIGVGLLKSGNPAEVLWVTIVLLAMLLFFSGNFLIVAKVVAFGGFLLVVEHYGSAPVQEIVVLTWVWWLLIGAVVDVFELIRITVSGDDSSDAYHLFQSTWIPGPIWGLVFLAGTVAALYAGGTTLLGMAA